MPDEQTPEQVAATVAAATDAKMAEMVQGAVRTSIEALVKEGQAKQAEIAAAKAAEAAGAAPAPTPFDDMLRPVLEPAFKAAKSAETRAAMAADAVAFLTDPANAQAMPYRQRIAEVIAQQAQKGTYVSMKDAWNWLRGGELYDSIVKEQEVGYAAKVEEARKAATVGASTPVFRATKPIDDMNTEELGAALKGLPF
jgi:hypothetical protein